MSNQVFLTQISTDITGFHQPLFFWHATHHLSLRLSVLDANICAQFLMIAILLVVYQGMVRLGENGRDEKIGRMVGNYMCGICTSKVKRRQNQHDEIVITGHHNLWPFWNSDLTSTMDFPPLFLLSSSADIPRKSMKKCHLMTSLSFPNFPQGCWDGNHQFFSFLSSPPRI